MFRKINHFFPFFVLSSAAVIGCKKDNNPSSQQAGVPTSEACSVDPIFPNSHVCVFDSKQSMADIQTKIDAIYEQQKLNEFGNDRYALMFKPGSYNLDIKVGYNTQVLGLGASPDDVSITGAVRTQDATPTDKKNIQGHLGALNTFWRSVENLKVTFKSDVVAGKNIETDGNMDCSNLQGACYPLSNTNVWAVSQASPMRRMHFMSHLSLFAYGWASGGFMANTKLEGLKNDWAGNPNLATDVSVSTGTQQQWFSRNIELPTNGNWYGGNWNMVFVGSKIPGIKVWKGGNQDGTYVYTLTNAPFPAFTSVEKTPGIAEKPFLKFDTTTQKYVVHVPAFHKDTIGVNWPDNDGKDIGIENFLIVNENTKLSLINSALRKNSIYKGVIFTPGVYKYSEPIVVDKDGAVVLGIGLPNIYPSGTNPILNVTDNLEGVRIAGFIFDGGVNSAATDLINVGTTAQTTDTQANPVVLSDIFCRVGGRKEYTGKAHACLTINSDNVVGDNLWLWRADHGNGVSWTGNTADSGLIVNGNNVTMYGLAVEHFKKYQTQWLGDNGKVYFYQSEMPYDPPAKGWGPNLSSTDNSTGYAAYYVGPNVKAHNAYGVGVYSYFKDNPVHASQGIFVEKNNDATTEKDRTKIVFSHVFTQWLNGYFKDKESCSNGSAKTGIDSVVNGSGDKISGCYTNNDVSKEYNLPSDVNADFKGTRQAVLQNWIYPPT